MSIICSTCGASLDDDARFCGSCGATAPMPEEDAGAVTRYRAVLRTFLEGGALDAKEVQQLVVLRQHLGLSQRTHERLVEELEGRVDTAAPAQVHAFIDLATMRAFQAGARCLVRVRVHNDGELALEQVALRGLINQQQPLEPAIAETVFPGEAAVASLWFTVHSGGFHELSGTLTTTDIAGVRRAYRLKAVQFRVSTQAEASQAHVVHIDQRSARVVDNSRSDFGVAPDANGGALVDEGEWHPVSLVVVALPENGVQDDMGEAADGSGGATGPAEAVDDEDFDEAAILVAPVDFRVTTDTASYHVTQTLALGDLSTVYGGVTTTGEAERAVAVKLTDDRGDNDLMQVEVRTLARLRTTQSKQNKHLPRVLDPFRVSDGRAGTIFERIDGMDLPTLRKRLPDGIPQRHVMWIMRRLLSVLGWAHSRGVIHGNIEPAHVMVRPGDHNVWLVDWCYAIVDPARTGQGFTVFLPLTTMTPRGARTRIASCGDTFPNESATIKFTILSP